MFNSRKIVAARTGLEQLGVSCLTAAVMAILYRRTEDAEDSAFPTPTDAADVGRIAADMALALRKRVGVHVQELLASEGADEFLEALAAGMVDDSAQKKP